MTAQALIRFARAMLAAVVVGGIGCARAADRDVATGTAGTRVGKPPGHARTWHVSPAGRHDGDGSAERPWNLATVFRHPAAIAPGDTVWLRGGTYGAGGATRYTSQLRGTAEAPIVLRQFPGERATVDGGILARGEWTWFWGFEITNTSPVRIANAGTRPPGLYLEGRGHRAINLVVNNTGHPAIGTWEAVGDGGEVYGCIIWGTGTYDTDRRSRRRGSAIYAQNRKGTRYIRDLISFRNFSTGMKAYTEKAYADGFHFEGNITFDNGDRLLFVSGRDHPVRRLKVINNYTYRTPTENDPPARLGYPDVDQVDAVVTGNHFVNGTHEDGAFWVKRFKALTVTGNTFVSPNMLATWIRPSSKDEYRWDANRYFGGSQAPFRIDSAACSWDDWKSLTTFDALSSRTETRPSGVESFLRPNAYDPSRAHLAVYNWDKAATVLVDLASFLKPGDVFTILDAQDYWGPAVAGGTFDGRRVGVPMDLAGVSVIRGDSLVPNVHTSAEFGAFVILRGGAR